MTCNFKNPNLAPVSFIEFKGPNHIFKSIHDSDIALENVEKDQIKLKSDLNHINQEPKYNKSFKQLNTIKILKIFMNQERKLSKCLIIMLKICLKIFMYQNKEKDLKY